MAPGPFPRLPSPLPPSAVCFSVETGAWVARPGELIVPLVPLNKSNAGTLDERGFSYPGLENAPNRDCFQPAAALGFEWVPSGCAYAAPGMTAADVAALLHGRWIHIDGDSLARDTYFDLLQALDHGEVARVKAHHNLSATFGATRVTMDFNSGNVPLAARCASPYSGQAAENFPHVWIYSLSLWENGACAVQARKGAASEQPETKQQLLFYIAISYCVPLAPLLPLSAFQQKLQRNCPARKR